MTFDNCIKGLRTGSPTTPRVFVSSWLTLEQIAKTRLFNFYPMIVNDWKGYYCNLIGLCELTLGDISLWIINKSNAIVHLVNYIGHSYCFYQIKRSCMTPFHENIWFLITSLDSSPSKNIFRSTPFNIVHSKL